MFHEDLRYIHEDVERLEQAIADRILEEPKQIRSRLVRDHEIASFLSRIQSQSDRALHMYNDEQETRMQEVQSLSTGDPFEEFYKQLDNVKSFHRKYPNEPVENLERAYRKMDQGGPSFAGDIDGMFTGEEAFGRFFDLTMLHEEYLNLPGVKGARKLTYLQYLDHFDAFTPPRCPITKQEKMTDSYFSYVGSLAQYLESFLRRTKPLDELEKLFISYDQEFEKLWDDDDGPGWGQGEAHTNGGASNGPITEGTGEGVWCADCGKEFKNDNVYKAHLTGKKHIKNAEARKQLGNQAGSEAPNGTAASAPVPTQRIKEKAIAEREHRIWKLAETLKTERESTRVNVERKAGMTDKERQQELAALYAEDAAAVNGNADALSDDEGEEKIYNPLKLPLAWDGKPIPFWLYKLHGLGVEFPCEICGNYVYMGRRAFDKHFSESRHIYGLKCLGITNTTLFREITGIEEARKLATKIQREKQAKSSRNDQTVEWEDSQGNVIDEKTYRELEAIGML